MERSNHEQEIRKMALEASWVQTSILWATIVNSAGKSYKKIVKSTDLYNPNKGSIEEEEPKIMTPEEVQALADDMELVLEKVKKKKKKDG